MSFLFCSSYAAINKAGAYADTDTTMDIAVLNEFSEQVEGTICMKTRKDWSAAYASTGGAIKGALADVSSDGVAIKIINTNLSGYLKGEDQTMLDVLKDNYDSIIKDLKEDANQSLNK